MLLSWIISFIFLIPFALEGLGIVQDHTFYLYLYLVLPFALYLVIASTTRKIKLPARLIVLIIVFFIFSNISTFLFSLDKQVSFERFVFFISLFLLFVFSYNNKAIMQSILGYVLVGLAAIFSIGSLIVRSASSAAQVIYPFYGSHNHLGDYLGVALLVLFTFRTKDKKLKVIAAVMSIVFFILLIFSFSRSAYLAFFCVIMLVLLGKRQYLPTKHLLVGGLILSIMLIALFTASSLNIPSSSPLRFLQTAAIKNLKLSPRELFSGRETYYMQALRSIANNPLSGVGAGNFIKISLAHNINNNYTDSAHNIFLEIAAEQGLFTSIVFLLICIFVVSGALAKKDVWGFIFIYLLINFQTDYTYQIFLFPSVAALAAGIFYEEKESIAMPAWVFGSGSLILFAVLFSMLTSLIMLGAGKPLEAIRWYPLNKWAYIEALQTEKNPQISEDLAKKGLRIAPGDIGVMLADAESLFRNGYKKRALSIYVSLYRGNPLVSFSVIKQIYLLKQDLESKDEADRFLGEVMVYYKNLGVVPDDFKQDVGNFCTINRGDVCRETAWW